MGQLYSKADVHLTHSSIGVTRYNPPISRLNHEITVPWHPVHRLTCFLSDISVKQQLYAGQFRCPSSHIAMTDAGRFTELLG